MASYYQSFNVTGSGEFPTDMLRYDHCYPANSESAVDMLLDHFVPVAERQPRTVRLSRTVDRKDCLPTVGRWASFGWRVSDVTTNKV